MFFLSNSRKGTGGRSRQTRRARKSLARCKPLVHVLEDRIVLTTNVFLDFGFAFPAAGLAVTNSLVSGVNGPEVFDTGGNTLISLTQSIMNQNLDLNGDSVADQADATIFADQVEQSVRRIFEPFDVIVSQVSADNFNDISNSLAANGNGAGNRDAYLIVAGDDPVSNPAFGWAPVNPGNTNDNTAFVFADLMIRSLGAAVLGVAGVAAHEASHTFGLTHTDASVMTGIGDIMGVPVGGVDLRNFFTQHLASRFDLGLQSGSGTQNNYEVIADPGTVGLRAGAAAYVTGTGAHDTITLAPAAGGRPRVDVGAFDDPARNPSDLIGTESYNVSTANGILVEAGFNDDLIVYDANAGARLEARGGSGSDTLRIDNAGSYHYTSGGSGRGTIVLVGGPTIVYSEIEQIRGLAPTAVIIGSYSIAEGSALTLDASTSFDPGDGALAFSWDVNGDGIFGDAFGPRPTLNRAQLNALGINDGPSSFTVTVRVEDSEGLSDVASTSLSLTNVAPTLALDGGMSVDEGGVAVLAGTISDPGTRDTFTLLVNWGDPLSPEDIRTYTFAAASTGTQRFLLTHRYLDDNPTSTPSDKYTITAKVIDDDGGSDQESTGVTVTNLAPVLTDVGSDAAEVGEKAENENVTVTARFTDAGTLDTHNAVIDWGDGSAVTAGLVNQGAGTGSAVGSHAYAAGGIYTVTVTLTDDDGGSVVRRTQVLVTGVGVHNGQLQIIGTGGDDNVTLNRQGNGGPFFVHASFLGGSPRRVLPTGFDEIVMVLGAGEDHATIAGDVRLPAIIDGGAGDDHLNGGKGRNVLIGGAGDDHLNGGYAADLLIGGTGTDRLVGNSEDDLLIAGGTQSEDDPDLTARYAALAAILDEWSTGVDPAPRDRGRIRR